MILGSDSSLAILLGFLAGVGAFGVWLAWEIWKERRK